MVPVLFTFYIQGVLKLKKNNSGAKRLSPSRLSFQHVGNIIGNTNNNNKCIKERIMMNNKACYANRQPVNSSLISRNSKLQIYRTSVRPAVTCGSESWTLTVEEGRALAVFERKTLRKIYGPVKENELWRIR